MTTKSDKEFDELEKVAFDKMRVQLSTAIEQHVNLSVDIDALTKFVYDMLLQSYQHGYDAGQEAAYQKASDA